MAGKGMVLAGPAGAGKTAWVLEKYQQVLSQSHPGAALWLTPNWRGVEDIRRRLLKGRVGYLAPGIMTFDRFAEAVVEFSRQKARLIDGQMKRHLVRQLVERRRSEGRLRYFAQIADSTGFIDLLSDWIREMKRLEIWPHQFRQACQDRGMTDKDQELLDIYEAYQELLTEHDLYDAEGRFWLARSLLGEGALLPPAGCQELQLVVVDGFTDFTRTQHEILEHLAHRTDQMLITLPLEKESGREDLFSKPTRTLQQLRRRHKGMKVEWLDRPVPPIWPALDHIERRLFANPRSYQPLAQKEDRIEILAAASQLGEVELLAKRIKRLLTEGCPGSGGRPVAPDDILVIFRSLDLVEGLVREVFGRYGIPFAMESSPPLQSVRSLAALVELIRLEVEDWPFRRLLAVLNHSYFQPDWPQWQQGRAGIVADRLIRRLQIPQGRENLLRALERLLQHPDRCRSPEGFESPTASESSENHSDKLEGSHSRFRQEVQTTLTLLRRLAEALDALPQRASLTLWGRAWRRLAEQVGIFRPIRATPPTSPQAGTPGGPEHPPDPLEELAWQQFQDLLESADRLWSWMGQPPPEWNPKEALAVLMDGLSRTPAPFSMEEAGRVRILTVRSARPLRAPYVFLAGLSEKAFPPPEPMDRLYNEKETEELIARGLPLTARRDQSCEEMLLFYEAVTRPTRQLVLSYPGLDESAQPLAPSPYLEELEAVCGPDKVKKQELFDLRPIPEPETLYCPRDFHIRAMADALEGDVSLLAGIVRSNGFLPWAAPGDFGSESGPKGDRSVLASPFDPSGDRWRTLGCSAEEPFCLGENILSAVRLMADRSNIDRFGPGEGMLQSAAVFAELQDRFPPDYVYSATALESYASCPFRFLLEQVLKLVPLEDLELEEDYSERGLLTHRILAEVHRRMNVQFGRPTSPTELEESLWETLLQQVIQETFADKPAEPVRAALYEVHRRIISGWLTQYRETYQKYEDHKNWADFTERPKPVYFEIAFGQSKSAVPYPPLELSAEGANKENLPKVRISGRIDRIDLGQAAGRVVFNILDYKTGQARWKAQKVETGEVLQLPLYLLAAQNILLADQKALPYFAGYWKVQEPGKKGPVVGFSAHTLQAETLTATEEYQQIQHTAVQTVFRLVRAIRSGQFPVFSPNSACTRNCTWKTACRIQQVRALEKSWPHQPPQTY